MIKITDYEVWGFKKAIEGIRNSYDCREKGDSGTTLDENGKIEFQMGENDLKLALRLIKGGTPERKFLRMIHVQADVLAPLYWWKQFDTYKVGTVANSGSTMHTITKKDFEELDFSITGDMESWFYGTINTLNDLRKGVIEAEAHDDKEGRKLYWDSIIQLLPNGYNQLRTVDLNYEVLMQMYRWRKNHKLDEWHDFCDWVMELPFMEDFIGAMKND